MYKYCIFFEQNISNLLLRIPKRRLFILILTAPQMMMIMQGTRYILRTENMNQLLPRKMRKVFVNNI